MGLSTFDTFKTINTENNPNLKVLTESHHRMMLMKMPIRRKKLNLKKSISLHSVPILLMYRISMIQKRSIP